ncbi:hypothetical protein Trydic_g8706 [Trypoxylus dichotomus]
MEDKLIKVLCHADDVTLFANNEDDLQRLPAAFNIEAQKLNIEILTTKTKSIAIEPRRYVPHFYPRPFSSLQREIRPKRISGRPLDVNAVYINKSDVAESIDVGVCGMEG